MYVASMHTFFDLTIRVLIPTLTLRYNIVIGKIFVITGVKDILDYCDMYKL